MNVHQLQPSIILASASPRRRELLQGLGIRFRVEVSKVTEEVEQDVTPSKYVEILAERKALDVASRCHKGAALVIGSDTVVVLEDEILGKPRDEDDAFQMLSRLQGKTHHVYTGVSVVTCTESQTRTAHSVTRVTMEHMTPAKIRRYIATGEPMDKAGAYAIQGIGATLVPHIEGDYFTVVGLPLFLLTRLLEESGFRVL